MAAKSKEKKRIANLEKRVTHLEEKVGRLIDIADHEKDPFIHLTLESDLTKQQVDALFALMDEARKSLSSGNPLRRAEFERRVYEIVPNRRQDYHFAEDIVATLKERYEDVYSHMKRDGMNI